MWKIISRLFEIIPVLGRYVTIIHCKLMACRALSGLMQVLVFIGREITFKIKHPALDLHLGLGTFLIHDWERKLVRRGNVTGNAGLSYYDAQQA
jgi:hypothetical protein